MNGKGDGMAAMSHVAIIGAGAMGCLFGARLRAAGHAVTFIVRRPEAAALLKERGVRLDPPSGSGLPPVTVRGFDATMDYAAVRNASLVLVLVKASATGAVAVSLAPHLGLSVREGAFVLSLQNGLGNCEALCAHIPAGRVAAGVTGNGAALLGEGHIRLGGTAETVVGELDGSPSERLADICAAFSAAGLPARVSGNITGAVWTKLMVNVGINALSALTGLRNGRIVSEPESFSVAAAAVREAAAVAAASGIRLETEDAVAHMKRGGELTALNETSMLQDLRAGRTTEIEALNGEIERRGKALGIPVPVNATLAALIRLREKGGAA